MPEISFIINAHNEGLLLVPALRSAVAARAMCEQDGISVEIILVADRADVATRGVISRASALDKVEYVEFGNLGNARLRALEISSASFVCFLDGDDVWQDTWPCRAYQFAKNHDFHNAVFHTEIFAGFGTTIFLRKQIQTVDALFHPLHLSATWHYCNNLFAHRSIFDKVPIRPYSHHEGFGSEDWHWSCETLAKDIQRFAVPHTAYFYRSDNWKAGLGSVKHLVLRPSKLFKDVGLRQDYGEFSGLVGDVSEASLKLVNDVSRKSVPPPWIFSEVRKARDVDLDIWTLENRLADLHVETPKLYPGPALLLEKVAGFAETAPYVVVGLDCDTIGSSELSRLAHEIRSLSKNARVVVMCGNILTEGNLLKEVGNTLFFNYKMLLRLENSDPYGLNQTMGNLLSNFRPALILNVNSQWLDYFLGDYKTFLAHAAIRTVKVLFGPVEDPYTGSYERNFIAGLNQNLHSCSEVWVKTNESLRYLQRILRGLDIRIVKFGEEAYATGVLPMIARDKPVEELEATPAPKVAPSFSLQKNAKNPFDITCVLNVHREEGQVIPTLNSIKNMISFANAKRVTTELLVVADNSNEETLAVIRRFGLDEIGCPAKVRCVDFGNLAKARREGAEKARGKYVAYLDADDLYSQNWISAAYDVCRTQEEDSEIVCHPEVNVYFGADHRLFWHPDMADHDVPMHALLLENFWTSLSFARKNLYLTVPVADIDLEKGFGFEDWQWNMETVAKGVVHRIAPRTSHFIRLKPRGSLNGLSAARNALVRHSSFPEMLIRGIIPKAFNNPANRALNEGAVE